MKDPPQGVVRAGERKRRRGRLCSQLSTGNFRQRYATTSGGGWGLDIGRVDRLVDGAQQPTLSHEESLKLFLDTFEHPTDAELCLPCAEAVLDIPLEATGQKTP